MQFKNNCLDRSLKVREIDFKIRKLLSQREIFKSCIFLVLTLFEGPLDIT
jgi:hypothetical protein